MEVAEWVGHRRLRAARKEMPCPRVISLRIAFGPAFRVFLRDPGGQVESVDKGESHIRRLTRDAGCYRGQISFVERHTLTL